MSCTAAGAEGDTPSAPKLWSLTFQDIAAPVILPDDIPLMDALLGCMQGWPSERAPLDPQTLTVPPLTILEARGNGMFRAHSRYLEEPMDDLPQASAICAVLADLSQAYSDLCSDHVFGLHCGGLCIGDTPIILAGERRAGKSTLVARLASDTQVRVIGDDVIPVAADGTLVGLGLAPRLRLPLPAQSPPRLHKFVQAHLGPHDDRYGYLLCPNLVPHGHRSQARAFVLLDRRTDGPAALHALPEDELLHAIVARSIAGPDGPESVFEAARRLTIRLVGLRLVYSDLDEAASLLHRAFPRDGKGLEHAVPIAPPLATMQAMAETTTPIPAISDLFARSPDAALRRIGDAAFLWRPGAAMLWHLNPTAHAVWALLEEPATPEEIALALVDLFPGQSPATLARDTCLLLARLAEEGFVALDHGRAHA